MFLTARGLFYIQPVLNDEDNNNLKWLFLTLVQYFVIYVSPHLYGDEYLQN